MNPEFNSFLESCGCIPPDHVEPGRWKDCATTDAPRKKKARIKLDDDGMSGVCIDWRTGEKRFWRSGSKTYEGCVDHAAIALRQRERVRFATQASEGARKFWDGCKSLNGPTPYLEGKGLRADGCHGIRLSSVGELVVPMERRGQIVSIQRIAQDGGKLFWPGAPTKEAYHVISRGNATLTVLCEGFATGATLFAAINTAQVIVTFSASNLPVVAEQLRPCGLVVIASDNDSETLLKINRNPGIESAKKASDILGCGIAIPDVRGSDWNDYLTERLAVLREDNMLSSWKKRPEVMRRSVLAEINAIVMREAKFIPYKE